MSRYGRTEPACLHPGAVFAVGAAMLISNADLDESKEMQCGNPS